MLNQQIPAMDTTSIAPESIGHFSPIAGIRGVGVLIFVIDLSPNTWGCHFYFEGDINLHILSNGNFGVRSSQDRSPE